jgi:hypothetical protein
LQDRRPTALFFLRRTESLEHFDAHMKPFAAEPEVIAGFGGAELVKHWNGKVELRGGSVEDQRIETRMI